MSMHETRIAVATAFEMRGLPWVTPREYQLPTPAEGAITGIVNTHITADDNGAEGYSIAPDLDNGLKGVIGIFNGILVTAAKSEDRNVYELRASGEKGILALRLSRISQNDSYTFTHAYAPTGGKLDDWLTGYPQRKVRNLARETFGINL